MLFMVDQTGDELWTALMHANEEVRFPKGLGMVGRSVIAAEAVYAESAAKHPSFDSTVDAIEADLSESNRGLLLGKFLRDANLRMPTNDGRVTNHDGYCPGNHFAAICLPILSHEGRVICVLQIRRPAHVPEDRQPVAIPPFRFSEVIFLSMIRSTIAAGGYLLPLSCTRSCPIRALP